jgi:shikimate kinase
MNSRLDCPDNIVLVGMPGAGKSTIGVLLAKRLGYGFVDSDLLLQSARRQRLQEIIEQQGLAVFKQMEAEILCSLNCHRTVIATGGSAVYSSAAMHHLQATGRIVFIDVPLTELALRVNDMDSRGLVIDPGEDFSALYAHRQPLYQRYAELTIASGQMSAEAVAAAIENQVCGQS